MLNEANDKNLFNQIKENLTKEAILILKLIFFSILDDHKISAKEISNQTKISFDSIDSILKRLDQQQLIVRERKGKIVGAIGLSLTPTSHKIKLNGRNYYCWCAADTIALPAALDADVEIKSRCGYDNNPIEITIRNGQLINVNPSSTTIWQVDFDPNRPLAGGT